MKKLCALAAALLVPVLTLTATAGAHTLVASGDTCTYTKSGTSYAVQVTTPSGAQQYAFAFGATGATVSAVSISGANGQFSTQGLPAGTTGAIVSDAPLPGSSSATVTVSGPSTGFVLAATSSAGGAYSDLVTCTVGAPAPPVSRTTATLSVGPKLVYVARQKVWHLTVTTSTAGTVGGVQLVATKGATGSSKTTTAKSGFQTHKVSHGAGAFTLVFHATPTGVKTLAKDGKATIRFQARFTPTGAGTVTKIVTLTFRR